MAIIHIPMLETLNFITPRLRGYLDINSTLDRTTLNEEIDVAKAVRDTLAHLYPTQIVRFDSFFQEAISNADVTSEIFRKNSIQFGSERC